jgi:hypothetical protein
MQYIDHRLKIAGSGSSEVFTDESLSLICRYAKGIPLALNTLCNNALSIGCSLSEQRISASTVKKVRREKGILTTEKARILASGIKRRLPRKIFFIIPALVLLAMALFFGGSYVQPLFDAQNSNHSVTPPAFGEKAPAPEVKRHDVAENVPEGPDPGSMAAMPETPHIPAPPPATARHSNTEVRVKEIVEVKKGANLYSIAYQYYKAADETFIDHILKLNPEITNPNLILVSQKIKIPEMTESLLIVQTSAHLFKVHLRTFTNLKSAGKYKRDIGLMGKEIEIVPWKVSARETWYRVMAGPFVNIDEASKALEEMKQKGFPIIPSKAEKS